MEFKATGSMPQSKPLDALLLDASDLVLVFDADERVPGHSLILKQWSPDVLGSLLASACCCSGSIIPMTGTSKKDWLTAMQFAYPVVPVPDITWDNLEVRLL
jgi:hypothetical protein